MIDLFKLQIAIDKAEGPGMCQYIYPDNLPCCVIGQYYVLMGGDPRDMKKWANKTVSSTPAVCNWEINLPTDLEFKTLSKIQQIWDRLNRGASKSEIDIAKSEMRSVAIRELYSPPKDHPAIL